MPREPRSESNPAEQTDDELYDVLTHIDREAYPERYQAIRDEFVRRHGDRINGRPVDDYFDHARIERPFAERSGCRKKVLIGLAVWSLFMLVVQAVLYLQRQR